MGASAATAEAGGRCITNFEFVFSLLAIILGLGLAEVLGGFARAVKRRDALRIGWGTGLLATWVMTETVIFWEIIWQSRDVLSNNSIALFPGVAVTGLYYFAGALVFPDDLGRKTSLDDYFLREKAKVVAAVLAAVALAFCWRRLAMGPAGWAVVPWYAWASLAIIYVAGPVVMLTRRRGVAIAALAVLVVTDLLDPVESLLWP
jgi:hypothetical protein